MRSRRCRTVSSPSGEDFNNVLKRTKALFKDGKIQIFSLYGDVWTGDCLGDCFEPVLLDKGTRVYERKKPQRKGSRWVDITASYIKGGERCG